MHNYKVIIDINNMLVEQYGTTTKYDANPRLVRYIKIKTMQRFKGKGVFKYSEIKTYRILF